MNIEIGWGSREIEFVPGDDRRIPHVLWRFIERGGHGGGPTGISYSWWHDPTALPGLIARLQEVQAEYAAWVEAERAKAEGERDVHPYLNASNPAGYVADVDASLIEPAPTDPRD